jgi:hypothetical protein
MLLDRLPRKLRDMIYNYYIAEDGGYHLDLESGKLRTSSGEKIQLSLLYSRALKRIDFDILTYTC